MEFRIETLTEKKLAGRHLAMSLAHNKTHELWKSWTTVRILNYREKNIKMKAMIRKKKFGFLLNRRVMLTVS
jgi:hypothetical protein